MSAKLSGAVLATKDFNPVFGDSANRFPNISEIVLSPDESAAYILDIRNGRVVRYHLATNSSAMVTANDAFAPHGNYNYPTMFWNGPRSKLIFVDVANNGGGGANKSFEADPVSGAVIPMPDLALEGGGVRASQPIYLRRVDESHAVGYDPFSQTGLFRYDYATHRVTSTPWWRVPRWGTIPSVRNGRIYTMLGIGNVATGGPIVSVTANAASRDLARIRWEVGHAAAAGSPMTSSTPCERRLFAPGWVTQLIVDPQGEHIYWSDITNNRIMCANLLDGGVVTTLVEGDHWNFAVFADGLNRIVAVKGNTTVKVFG